MVLTFSLVSYGVYAGVLCGGMSLFVMVILLSVVLRAPRQPEGTDCQVEGEPDYNKMVKISEDIEAGSDQFLKTEYSYLALFVVTVATLICFSPYLDDSVDINQGWKTALNFVLGATLSALAGFLGMYTAVRANVRTTTAAAGDQDTALNDALKIAFKSGTVMGLTVVGFGLLGLSFSLTVFLDPTVMAGFGFGASSIALFARVGGGIFTKAADVGADLCGKVAFDLDEDDPRNPAVIADNVGDNVGDVAGMGADLFESYVGSIIACLTLAQTRAAGNEALLEAYTILPFFIAGGGVLCSIIGTFCVSVRGDANMNSLLWALRRGLIVAAVLVIGLSYGVTALLAQSDYMSNSEALSLFSCVVIGLVAGMIIGFATEYYTSFEYEPVKSIARSGMHGHAPVIIEGMGVGMISTIIPVVVIVFAMLACVSLCGLYGVALAGVGMLSTLGITLATDAYGPVADNAGGIAEMAELDESVRNTTDALDALGNTTAATGKGFAIGSAVLTAVALMASFILTSNIEDGSIDIMDDVVIPGVLVGAMLPFVFAAFTMLSVRRGAHAIMDEVKLQFEDRENIKEETGSYDAWSPNNRKCIAIATSAAVLEMVMPGAMAVLVPVIIGFGLGAKALAGMLVGSISAGFLLAVTMANAGGAWDNAKKWVEAGHIPGHEKKSDLHKATVTGDTVGDPFKDTSGPALNILIKLMSVVSLVFAPVFPATPFEQMGVACILLAVLSVVCLVCKYLIAKNNTGYQELNDDNGTEMN
jgi:H(+)-translocating pyrophosphatase